MRYCQFVFLSFLLLSLKMDAQWIARHNLSSAQYQEVFNEAVGKGMRPICVSGYSDGGAEKYAALFEKKAGPTWSAMHGMSSQDYQNNFNSMNSKGFQVSYISGYEVGGKVKYAAIWEKKSKTYITRHGQNGSDYQAEFDKNTKAGYRLTFVTCYSVGSTILYASIFEKSSGPAYKTHHGMSAIVYQQKFNEYTGQGYRLKLINGCNVGGTDYYAAIWEKTGGPLFYSKHGIKGNNYQNNFDNFYYQGYKPSFISAFASSGTERFNGIWENTNFTSADLKKIDDGVTAYMSSQGVKALSIAVCSGERLVFAKGYGDANTSTGQDLSPNYSLRIMSISKPVTSTGIMMLVSKGKLNLNQKVFGTGSIFGSKYAYPDANKASLETITVRSMLHHTSGLRSCNGETEFNKSTSTHDDCMKVLLKDANLFSFAPNTMALYSNTNYFFLARIIEQISGQGYETYIRNTVLNPSGVGNTMFVGEADGNPTSKEVAAYTPMKNMNLKNFDGFGGWVARPIDLLKVLVRFDGRTGKQDLISAALQDTMTTATTLSNGYALGWIADNQKQTHNGCFPGTRSFLYYDIPSGLSFAVIVNNDPADDGCGWKMQAAVLNAIKTVSKWPTYDLF